MKLHTHVHHGRKPFVCDTCNKSYTSVSGLKTHWKTHAPCSSSNDEERLARIKEENLKAFQMKSLECGHQPHHHHDHHNHPSSKFYHLNPLKYPELTEIFKGPPETSMDMMSANGSSVNGQEYPETEETDEDFDDEIPDHRRMTVTRVTDHAELAELADSVLSAQSAPTINLTPISPKFGHHPHHHHHPHQTINDVIEASVKMEQAH